MESNPARQWFVYDKEREQGPFNEEELTQRIRAQEFSFEAYVYTEGMSDWALIKDTPILTGEAAVASSEAPLESPAEKPKESVPQNTKTEVALERPSEPLIPENAPVPPIHKAKAPILKVVVASLAVLALLFALYENRSRLGAFLGLGQDSATVESNNNNGSVDAAKSASSEWERLRNYRIESTAQGPSFILDSAHYTGDFPVLKGAISPLLPLEGLKAALFPDPTRNILPVPFVHFFKLPVHDGFFVVGPLQVKGQNLPAGRYKLLLASDTSFLGEATFEVGHWPTQVRLIEIEKKLFAERRELAQKEKEAMEKKLSELAQAELQLREIDKNFEKGPRTKAAWSEKTDPWFATLSQALGDQERIMRGPMFYPVFQQALYQIMQDLQTMAAAYQEKHLTPVKRASSMKIIAGHSSKIENNVAQWKKNLQNTTLESENISIQLDKDIVKKQLMETW
jgi:hypothetical protein